MNERELNRRRNNLEARRTSELILEDAKDRWKLFSKNLKFAAKQSWLQQQKSFEYEHYGDIPSVNDFVRGIQRFKRQQEAERRTLRKDFKAASIHDLTEKRIIDSLHAQKAVESIEGDDDDDFHNPHSLTDTELLADIVRIDVNHRTAKQIKFMVNWLQSNTKTESVVGKFLSDCSTVESFQFARGLVYKIVDEHEFVIQQHDVGDSYYILISGACDIYVNNNLPPNEKPHDPRKKKTLGTFCGQCAPGADFGELALANNALRAASIVSTEICELLVCSRKHFNLCIQAFAHRIRVELVADLKTFGCFKTISDSVINTFVQGFSRRKFQSGAILQKENKRVKTIYFLLKGECTEEIGATFSENGQHIKFSQIISPHIIGAYFGLQQHKVASTTIIAKTTVDLIQVNADFANVFLPKRLRDALLHIASSRYELIQNRTQRLEKIFSPKKSIKSTKKQYEFDTTYSATNQHKLNHDAEIENDKSETIDVQYPQPKHVDISLHVPLIFDEYVRKSIAYVDSEYNQRDKNNDDFVINFEENELEKKRQKILKTKILKKKNKNKHRKKRKSFKRKRTQSMPNLNLIKPKKPNETARQSLSRGQKRTRSRSHKKTPNKIGYPYRYRQMSFKEEKSHLLNVQKTTLRLNRKFGEHVLDCLSFERNDTIEGRERVSYAQKILHVDVNV